MTALDRHLAVIDDALARVRQMIAECPAPRTAEDYSRSGDAAESLEVLA